MEPLGSEWSSEALLWFQTLVDGEQLSARVLSASEQGYNVKLESRGQDVAAALISEQLAKAPGAIPEETHAATVSEAKHQEKTNENEHSQIHEQASNKTGANSKEIPTEGAAVLPERQLECMRLKDEMRWFGDFRTLNETVLCSGFSSILPRGLENSGAASQGDL